MHARSPSWRPALWGLVLLLSALLWGVAAQGAMALDVATPGGEVSLETPAAPAVQDGVTPGPSVPAIEAADVVAAPVTSPAEQIPVVPVVETPEVQAPELPAVQTPELPAVQTPALPAVRVPALPTVQTLALPTVRVPALPTVQTLALPAVRAPALPAVRAPVGQAPAVDPSVEPGGAATAGSPGAGAVQATGAPAERAAAPPIDAGTRGAFLTGRADEAPAVPLGARMLDLPTDLTKVGATAVSALPVGGEAAAAAGSGPSAPAPAPQAPDLPGLPDAPAGPGGAGAAPQLLIGGLAAILSTLVLFSAAGISRRLRLPPEPGGPTVFLSLLTRPG